MHGRVMRLMVDRRASSYAGLRSTSLRQRTAQANHQHRKQCEAAKLSSPPAAERLRSTLRSRQRLEPFGLRVVSRFISSVLRPPRLSLVVSCDMKSYLPLLGVDSS
jgi:hypothetical protein